MRLTISSIADRGVSGKERLILKVGADLDVGKYAIFRTRTMQDGSLSTGVDNVFWFPDRQVKSGDLIVLYSKAGETNCRTRDDGSTVHFYYWGQAGSMWASDAHVPVVVNTSSWEALRR